MKKINQGIPQDKKRRPLWLTVIGFISAPVLALSVIGIILALFVESETIVKVILPVFLVLLFVISVGGILFALLFKKKKNE